MAASKALNVANFKIGTEPIATDCVQASIQPRLPASLASGPVVPEVPSEDEEDLSSVSLEVVEPHSPSSPDPVPPAPPVPSASSSTSVSSSLSPDQIALKRLICMSLPQPPNCTLTWSSPEISSFIDGLLSQSSFSVSLRDFAVSYVWRLIYDYLKRLLMPVKVNVRKFCTCVEFTV